MAGEKSGRTESSVGPVCRSVVRLDRVVHRFIGNAAERLGMAVVAVVGMAAGRAGPAVGAGWWWRLFVDVIDAHARLRVQKRRKRKSAG